MSYKLGQLAALERLGLNVPKLKQGILSVLEGPYGEYITRVPVQATMGGIGGAGTGLIMGGEHPGEQAAWGALMGAGGGLAVAGAPHLRKTLINALRRS